MAEQRSASSAPMFHHIGIQTNDLKNATAWYEAFLGCRSSWSLTDFSALTRSRLPGIKELHEVVVGNTRIHLFERAGRPAPQPGESVVQFQHLCLAADSPADLVALRNRWIELYGSGRYTFALSDQPTDIVIDAAGVQSFYTYDVNGLEFEFTYDPGQP
jgi:catechol 2,3-dioxygenase-like lactoylglutathione lyase family enzyme